MIAVATDSDEHVVSIRLDHLHLGHVDDMQPSVEFREQARALLRQRARAALELREQTGEQRLALVDAARQVTRAHPRERLAEALLVEGLQ